MNRVGEARIRQVNRMQLLSGRAHPALAKEIADQLDIKLSEVLLENFANGEIRVRFLESMRGDDVFIVQTHSGRLHSALMEQLLMIDAAKRASARSITAVCPLLSYSRQDRKSAGREPIGARLVVDMLAAAGADRIMSVDLHSGQTQGFFDGPFDHLIAFPLFRKYIQENFGDDVVFVAPDAGRVKLTERYSSRMGAQMAIIHKTRSTKEKNTVEAKHLIGDVDGRNCVIIDDMIDTAGTFCAAADMLKERGAKTIHGLATHGIFSGDALEKIEGSAFEKVVVTNTMPIDTGGVTDKVVVLSVAGILADAISAVANSRSVSAIFEGENQI
ncbi:MAG TPA: ribose-phosphate diphosphokinase [Candidatus Saccharimonadia bacterium]|nr:ribose-phosphate diphosphokinase [Candidatus Saccharimonadia bacterium]